MHFQFLLALRYAGKTVMRPAVVDSPHMPVGLHRTDPADSFAVYGRPDGLVALVFSLGNYTNGKLGPHPCVGTIPAQNILMVFLAADGDGIHAVNVFSNRLAVERARGSVRHTIPEFLRREIGRSGVDGFRMSLRTDFDSVPADVFPHPLEALPGLLCVGQCAVLLGIGNTESHDQVRKPVMAFLGEEGTTHLQGVDHIELDAGMQLAVGRVLDERHVKPSDVMPYQYAPAAPLEECGKHPLHRFCACEHRVRYTGQLYYERVERLGRLYQGIPRLHGSSSDDLDRADLDYLGRGGSFIRGLQIDDNVIVGEWRAFLLPDIAPGLRRDGRCRRCETLCRYGRSGRDDAAWGGIGRDACCPLRLFVSIGWCRNAVTFRQFARMGDLPSDNKSCDRDDCCDRSRTYHHGQIRIFESVDKTCDGDQQKECRDDIEHYSDDFADDAHELDPFSLHQRDGPIVQRVN